MQTSACLCLLATTQMSVVLQNIETTSVRKAFTVLLIKQMQLLNPALRNHLETFLGLGIKRIVGSAQLATSVPLIQYSLLFALRDTIALTMLKYLKLVLRGRLEQVRG